MNDAAWWSDSNIGIPLRATLRMLESNDRSQITMGSGA